MEILVLLLYGDVIPPHKHIKKIAAKFTTYFLDEWEKEDYIEDEYVEIRIEERYLGLRPREFHYPPIVPVKKEYLLKFINIFKTFNCNVCLCNEDHEHPSASIDGLDYEGYCYYMQNEDKKIVFLEEYRIEDEGVNVFDLYEKGEKDSAFNFKDFIMNNYIDQSERHSIDHQEWYRTLSVEKKFKILEAKTDTDLVMEQWLKEVVHLG